MGVQSDSAPAVGRKPVVIVRDLTQADNSSIFIALTAGVVSVLAHMLLILLIMGISINNVEGSSAKDVEEETAIEELPKDEPDLTNTDIGIDTTSLTQFNVERIEEISVPGYVDPTAPVGILNAPDGPQVTIPAPPGSGGGTGAAPPGLDPGLGNLQGTLGGMGGILGPGGFGGRSGATRERAILEGGGNSLSEAGVAQGLKWLALHQAQDGHWSLDGFNRIAREKPFPAGKISQDDSNGMGNRRNDVAATALALLPFLGSGQTHKSPPAPRKEDKAPQFDYSKGINEGLKFLISKQGKDGYFGGDMYSHSLAAIVMCEAYGLTSDPMLKLPAQKSLNYLVDAQDPIGGGWRYTARQPGDTSVTGWALMALKSGQMASLSVPATTIKKVERFIDSVETANKGGFCYMPGNPETPSMTAVGLLCRQYLGSANPRNPSLIGGIPRLKAVPPDKTTNLYYLYYATQVMHHMGGEGWKLWNEGSDGKSGIRNTLLKRQDAGTTRKGNAGSWTPTGDFASEGGRIMETSLSILCLEVYYRHLPLYRRDAGVARVE